MKESPSSNKMKTEILAMILAGGKGSRLGKLTQKIAKPADLLAVAIGLLILH